MSTLCCFTKTVNSVYKATEPASDKECQEGLLEKQNKIEQVNTCDMQVK